jgi:osmotically inducible protein OsmC
MELLYTAVATARGGREGEVVSDDGVLDLSLSVPEEMGGPGGDHSNPEQLLAAGYAACFHNALLRVAGEQGLDLEPSEVTARVGIGRDGKGFGLAVTLVGALPTLDPPDGERLMQEAHELCPFSRATRGNIGVTLELAPAPGA